MKLENQVTSLELSKRLNELGVKQDGFYIWYKNKGRKAEFEVSPKTYQIYWKEKDNKFIEWYSAFTVAELGEMLPRYYPSHKESDDPFPRYRCFGGDTVVSREDYTEADARAKMLIYLIENKLL